MLVWFAARENRLSVMMFDVDWIPNGANKKTPSLNHNVVKPGGWGAY